MNIRLTAIAGICTGFFFAASFVILFVFNPQTYEELNNLSLASYNIPGMNAQTWAINMYCVTGLLNIIFCICFLSDKSCGLAGLIGKILLMVCGVIWLSFGLLPYDPAIEIANHILLIRLIIFIIASFSSFLLLGSECDRISKQKFLKWYTLTSAGLIMLLSLLSAFVYNDETWIRTNVSLTVYFVWFMVFGLSIFKKQNLPSSSP